MITDASTNPAAGRRPRRAAATVLVALLIVLLTLLPSGVSGAAPRQGPHHVKPTIVVVHGAFADASGFAEVIANLQRRGYPVIAPANPLRGVASDSAYLKSFLATVPGPLVLVGHSYGGAVITNAATGDADVKALVYIAAYALDQGESIAAANGLGGGSTELTNHLLPREYVGGMDGYIDPASFRDIFAADLPSGQTQVMAASQRPASLAALEEPSGVPAWRTIPSWYLVASDDHAIPPAAERVMAARARAHTVEIASSHVAMTSHPRAVTRLILTAARTS